MLTTVLIKFHKTTLLLPVSSSTPFSTLHTHILQALQNTNAGSELGVTNESDFALFKMMNSKGGNSEWEALESDGVLGNAGLDEAQVLGLGLKGKDGAFSEPEIEIPQEEDFES